MEGVLESNCHETGLGSAVDLTYNSSFFQDVTSKYGFDTTRNLKSYKSILARIARIQSGRRFLIRCRKLGIFPRNILNATRNVNSIKFFNEKNSQLLEQRKFTLNKYLLKLEIKDVNYQLKFLIRKKDRLIHNIRNSNLDAPTMYNFFNFTSGNSDSIYFLNNSRLNDKIDNTQRPQFFDKMNFDDKKDWIKNLTDTQLPKFLIYTLTVGDNFSIATNISKSDIVNNIKNFEFSLLGKKIDSQTENEMRSTFVNIYTDEIKNNRHSPLTETKFYDNLKKTRQFLKDNPHLMFTHADKGNVTVCIEKNTYFEKMRKLLDNKKFYEIITPDQNFLTNRQKDVYEIFKHFDDLALFGNNFNVKNYTQTDTLLAKCYGLPKIHKIDIPMRPIISTVNSPTESLSKIFLNDLKKAIKLPNSHIDNSFKLIEKIKNLHIPPDYYLVSLDVVSLFTNIPLSLVINSLDKRYSDISSKCTIPFTDIINCTKFLFNNTYFTFENVVYRQIFGTPMGSAVSPLFADLVMDDLEKFCLEKLKKDRNITPLFYYRYVDDILLCIPQDRTVLAHVLTTFNSYDDHIEFTHEIEKDNKINFLDITLIRQDDNIITNWYRKEIFTTRTLNYFSNHTDQQKKNIVYNLIDRAIKLADPRFHNSNILIVKKILKINDYDENFIKKHIKIRCRQIQLRSSNLDNFSGHVDNNDSTNNINTQDNNPNNNPLTIPIYFNNKRSYDRVSKSLRKFGARTVPQIKKPLRKIIKLGKDITPELEKTGAVYKLSCLNCPAEYVGQTKRPACERISDHINFKDPSSVVSLHRLHNEHEFDWENTCLLDVEREPYKRSISEMLFINANPENLNKQEDVRKMSPAYKRLCHKLR